MHLRAVAILMASVVTVSATVGALRPCWGVEHRHAGMSHDDCLMHHGVPAPAGHGHHGHHAGPGDHGNQGSHDGHGGHGSHDTGHAPATHGPMFTCNCADDPGAPLILPHAILAVRAPHSGLTVGDLLASEPSPRVPGSSTLPLSPPPRSSLS